jgi:hypothetical protein
LRRARTRWAGGNGKLSRTRYCISSIRAPFMRRSIPDCDYVGRLAATSKSNYNLVHHPSPEPGYSAGTAEFKNPVRPCDITLLRPNACVRSGPEPSEPCFRRPQTPTTKSRSPRVEGAHAAVSSNMGHLPALIWWPSGLSNSRVAFLVRPLLFLAPNENVIRQTSETEAKGGRLSAAFRCPARTRVACFGGWW